MTVLRLLKKIINSLNKRKVIKMTENFVTFNKLIRDQFEYGGKKYANKQDSTKESTDILFDIYSYLWLFGTIDKYTHRFNNLERERDLLKISCYMYISWLKRGYHLSKEGKNDGVIDTTVEVKSKFFEDFIITIGEHYNSNKNYYDTVAPDEALRQISKELRATAGADRVDGFFDIKEEHLANIYCLSYSIWNAKYFVTGQAGQDTDTFNEEKHLQSDIAKVLEDYFHDKPNVKGDAVPMLVYTVDEEDISELSKRIAELVSKGAKSGRS